MIEISGEYANVLKGQKFIDLFCGLGGFRLALESFGAECVFSSDIDKHVSEVYKNNFNDDCLNDITKVDEKDIPPFDILTGGFPCQAFSIAGKRLGFEDTRGTLFRDIVRITEYHKPKLLFLENVKNLTNHDGGKTFGVIRNCIEDVGYNIYYKVLNASKYGIPQCRERVYMICIRKDIDNGTFEFPKEQPIVKCIKDILVPDSEVDSSYYIDDTIVIKKELLNECDNKLLPTETTIFPRIRKIGHLGETDYQTRRVYSIYGQAPTLTCRHSPIISKCYGCVDGKLPSNEIRRLVPREEARLMGFPDSYKITDKKSHAPKQFGNSIIINVLQYIIKSLIDTKAMNW